MPGVIFHFFPLQSTFSCLDQYSDNKDHITTSILWLGFQKLRDTIAIVIDLRTCIVIETTVALATTIVVSAMTTKRQRETTMSKLQFLLSLRIRPSISLLLLCCFYNPFILRSPWPRTIYHRHLRHIYVHLLSSLASLLLSS